MINRIFNFLKYFFNDEKIKIGYKVVDWNMSSFSSIKHGGIEYKLNQKIYPKEGCGPLCIFGNLENIKNFLDATYFSGIFLVFKCKYRESKKKKVWNNCCKIVPLKNLPYGTKLADWVELIEEIKLTKEEIDYDSFYF